MMNIIFREQQMLPLKLLTLSGYYHYFTHKWLYIATLLQFEDDTYMESESATKIASFVGFNCD